MTIETNDDEIIPSGMQIVDSRTNHGKTGTDRKLTAIVDPTQIKFYELLTKGRADAKKAGKKPKAMFKVSLLHWDEKGEPTTTEREYAILDPQNVAIFKDIIENRLSPPKPKGRVAAGDAARPPDAGTTNTTPNDGLAAGGGEAADAAAAAAGGEAGPGPSEDAERQRLEAEKKAEEKKAKDAADKKAKDDAKAKEKEAEDKKAAEDKKKADDAAEKARKATAETEQKAKEATAEANKPKATDSTSEDFSALLDEDE